MRLWGAAGETKAKLHMMSALEPRPAASFKSWVSQRHHCIPNTHTRDPTNPHLNFFPQASRTLGPTLLSSLFLSRPLHSPSLSKLPEPHPLLHTLFLSGPSPSTPSGFANHLLSPNLASPDLGAI